MLPGKLRFQQCSDTVCEAPETISFDLPLTIEPFMVAPTEEIKLAAACELWNYAVNASNTSSVVIAIAGFSVR